MTPEERFDQAFRVADDARQQVLTFLSAVSQSKSQRRSSPQEWSIGEIAHHLLLVERRLGPNVLAILAAAREGEFEEKHVLANRPFPLRDVVDVRKSGKGNADGAVRPTRDLDLKELGEQLRSIRNETKSKLAPHRSRNLGNLWYRHPRLGPMTLYERITLAGYHELKHLAQMQRTLERLRP